jgi:CDP-paratose 2-epimerase
MTGAGGASHTTASETTRPTLGLLEWFRPGAYDHVEATLADLKALGIDHLRTAVSWADWHTEQGQNWYAWLLPRLCRDVNLLPCFTSTPPSLGIVPKTSAPPRHPKDYADVLEVIMTRFGKNVEWVELWNAPNNLNNWDWCLDPSWQIFCDMIIGAAYRMHQRGKKTVLGGMCSTDPNWLDLLCRGGVMQHIDVVGVHGFPGTWENDAQTWPAQIAKIQAVLTRHHSSAAIWITEAGYSTWRHDEYRQVQEFVKLIDAPVQRVYWYSAYDLHPDLSPQGGFHEDERPYHFGLKRADGKPKLIFRFLAHEGIEGVKALAQLSHSPAINILVQHTVNGTYEHRKQPAAAFAPLVSRPPQRPVLITGGAGFIGTNLAHRLLASGLPVLILDNLSRPGVERNVRALRAMYGSRVQVHVADVRNPYVLRDLVQQAQQVFHFAAQVAVTTSLEDPLEDFEVNLRGTLNLLEGLRRLPSPPPVIFTSTNKVYGALADIRLRQAASRYEPADRLLRRDGIDEQRPLRFYSPYGCSKGAADQYVLDYARMYGLPAVVFRMSCIYGPHQCGTEDQGWVAHFLLRALAGEPITLYGDGLQVRDILFVQDLIDALLLAQTHIERLAGEAFNVGGGPANVTSLLELLDLIGTLHSERPRVHFDVWRPGDQKYYVSNTQKFAKATGWLPKIGIEEGVNRLYSWLHRSCRAPIVTHVGSNEGANGR